LNPEFERVVDITRRWVEHAVIGLNLCPFAKAVNAKGQIYYAVSQARSTEELLDDLRRELAALAECEPAARETTLLIAPHCLYDFLEFNAALARAERLLARARWAGIFQLASFHPRYQFADTDENDITNFTNRSPYPILQLLREASVARAVGVFPETQSIYETNMETLRKLGLQGWNALGLDIP
jgi:hypothetical protein